MENIQKVLEKAETLLRDKRKKPYRKQIKKLLNYLSDHQLNVYKNAKLYKIKGLALSAASPISSKNFKEAIPYLKKSIELDPNDAEAYEGLGKGFRFLRNFKDSLIYYNTAITLNPKDPSLYIGRARTHIRLHKKSAADKDLEKAVRIDPKNPKGYYLRSDYWRRIKGNKERSIKDFIKAVKLDPEAPAFNYFRLGNYFLDKKKYELAFENYNKAIDKDPSIDYWEMDMFVYIYNALSVVNNYKRGKIYEACAPTLNLIESIRTNLDYYEYQGSSIVHFTKLSVADILLASDQNKMRFYHASYMNDPEEGKILLQIFEDTDIVDAFSRAEMNIESNFYLGSFLPLQNADELVMWRTYGKDEHDSEAKGCSLVIKRDFFDEAETINKPNELNQTNSKTEETTKKKQTSKDKNKERQSRVRFDTSLHKVMYFDKKTKKILGNDGQDIKRDLIKLRTQIRKILAFRDLNSGKESKLNKAIDSIVYNIITELRYYFKSADYSYENEERVVLSVPPRSPLVKIEDGKLLPKRLYVEAKNPLRKYINKIILGPRVIHPERWLYLKAWMIKNDFDIDLIKSNCKFQ
jgi:tetratricopeptide (TPR) repeat protein